jgi:hypothetical protein
MMLPPIIQLTGLQVADGRIRKYLVAVFIFIIKSCDIGVSFLCKSGIEVEVSILFFSALISNERTCVLHIIELKLLAVGQ